jgi:arylsulfatase A-like enzyme
MRGVVRPAVVVAASLAVACGAAPDSERRAAAGRIVHLADQLATAAVRECGEPPPGTRERRSWDLASEGPAGEWKLLGAAERPHLATLAVSSIADGLRLDFARPPQQRGPLFIGGLAIDLAGAGLDVRDWDTVRVKARTRQRFAGLAVAYNLDEEGALPGDMAFFYSTGDVPPIFNDGSVQTYAMPLKPREGEGSSRALSSLAVIAGAPGAAALELLGIELVARGAGFAEPCGARPVTRDGETRTSIFAHAPSRLAFRVAVPRGGRLDTALSVLPGDAATVRVRAAAPGAAPATLLEEQVVDGKLWAQRSVDLSEYGGSTIELTLEVAGERAGDAALFGAPIVAAPASASPGGPPNVVFYVIDGGGADLMSLYGYNRRTTPFLDRLAAEGVVFERAFSNATWTQPSTASFMTSLQHSVLGGLRRGVHSTPVPAEARTMIERLRAAGWQTASFTANPNAGRMIGIERGVDLMRDSEEGGHSTSSQRLHDLFWRFRDEYPGGPWFVHFQTTDVHEPNEPTPPYSGLWVTPEQRQKLHELDGRIWQSAGALFGTMSILDFYDQALERAGIDRQEYFNIRRGLYDETMAYQDAELEKFVRRLKSRGEWENTILVVGADHGHPAGTFARFGRGLFVPQPEPWQGALFDSFATRVPLLVVWPREVRGGRRIEQPVSMIDVLPTLLELLGLPRAEVAQGQSLAPLLAGREQTLRPVVLDEFRVDEATGEMVGNLEIVDGRWGASLEIGPQPGAADPARGRHQVPVGGRWGALHRYFPEVPRLLLYDLWADPFARQAVNDRHPELVERYTRELVALWKANQALAQRFRAAGEVELDPEQLRQLKALGYIQ